MILWREKVRAFAIHFVATLAVALVAAALIFFVWYPDPFQRMLGGLQLFLLVAGCDLALGPLVSFVIYSSKKKRRALIFDYTVVGIVQVAAFVYGVYSVSQSRPAYVAFVKDRIEVISAGEIAERDYEEARGSKYAQPPFSGPAHVAAHVPPQERNEVLWASLEGRDIGVRPKFYVDYSSQREAIQKQIRPVSELLERHPKSRALVEKSLQDLDRAEGDLGWLPVKHAKGFWTAVMDKHSAEPVKYLPIDPY